MFDKNKAHSNGWDKSRLVSRYVTEGAKSAPHRSYYYAMGISEEEIHQPWSGLQHVGMRPRHVIFPCRVRHRRCSVELVPPRERRGNLQQLQ